MLESCTQVKRTRWTLFARCFQHSCSAGKRSRRLAVENLESRLALSGVPLPSTDGSLARYLDEAPVMGPALPAVVEAIVSSEAPVLDAAAIEAADALAALLSNPAPTSASEDFGEGEGESDAPTMLSFDVSLVDGGWVRLAGQISDNDPAGAIVYFGGLFENEIATCDPGGYFVWYVSDPGYSGFVSAYAVDLDYNMSPNTLEAFLI